MLYSALYLPLNFSFCQSRLYFIYYVLDELFTVFSFCLKSFLQILINLRLLLGLGLGAIQALALVGGIAAVLFTVLVNRTLSRDLPMPFRFCRRPNLRV